MEQIWKQAKETLKDSMSSDCFQRWIAPLHFLGIGNEEVAVNCPNAFFKEWVEGHHRREIQKALETVNCGKIRLHFKVNGCKNGRPAAKNGEQLSFAQLSPSPLWESGLNTKFTFDRFVVGQCNEFAYTASMEVARTRKTRYNPLLLLADVGLGKSHLSCAIGNHIQEHCEKQRVYYTTAEGFINDMVHALKAKQSEAFKKKFRAQCDVLVLEGVEFLSGKSRTQIELTHTLDALQNANKQIILTSNTRPREIPEMADTLKSRLMSGLVVDIKPPDPQTRRRILKQKARQEGFELPDEVTEFLADRVNGNVRQLEGVVIHLMAKASLLHRPVDMDSAKEIIQDLFQDMSLPLKPTIRAIQECVCRYFQMEPETLISRSRKKAVYYPRQVAMYLCRNHTDATLAAIGKAFNRDHASVLHSLAVIQQRCKADAATRNQIAFLADELLKAY
jgi:chromosomal replication initiator protein